MLRSTRLLRSLKQAAQESVTSQISYVTSNISSSTSTSFAAGRIFSTAAASTPEVALTLARVRQLAQLYKQLSKAKLSALVVSTTAAGFVAGSGDTIDWKKLWWTYVGTTAAASSANALNQIYEVTNDSLMKRTQRRPLPAGKMSLAHALAFAAVTGFGGIGILASQVQSPALLLLAINCMQVSMLMFCPDQHQQQVLCCDACWELWQTANYIFASTLQDAARCCTMLHHRE